MRTAIVYHSNTGNTKKVAEAIASVLPGEVVAGPLQEAPSLEGCDLVFLGMPVDRFGAPKCIEPYVQEHLAGRRVALFVTHAAPEDEPELVPALERCRETAGAAEIVGFFDCQGELDPKVAKIMMFIPGLRKFAKRQPETKGQPDASRLEAARAFARRVAAVPAEEFAIA
jgi:flavodoxin